LEVLERVRADPRTRRVPVLMLTASTERRDIARAYDLGANAYLVKPPSIQELTELMRSVKEFWISRNQFPPPSENGN
jgi:two-component system, response regulator